MVRLLTQEEQSAYSEGHLDVPVNSNFVLRKVAPDRQALTLGELVELLKADELAQVLEEQSNTQIEEKVSNETTSNPE